VGHESSYDPSVLVSLLVSLFSWSSALLWSKVIPFMQVFMVFKSFLIALIVYAWHARSAFTATRCILTPLPDSARWCVLRWAGLDMISVLSPQIRPILDRGGKRRSYAGVLRVSFYCPFVALGLLLRAHSRFCRLWFLAFIAASYSSFRSVRIFVLEWLLIILSIRGPFRLHLLIGVRIRVTLRRRLRCQDRLPFALLIHSLRHGSLACRLIVWTSVPYWAAVVAEPSCRALERLISLRAPILRITLFLVDVLLSILSTIRSFSLSLRDALKCV